ncbi:MAG: cysteine desulfurase family protein [Cytophagales bacterium]|nr:cysteine desulfurase family protein [Cytophagales bacterium]
MKNFLFVFFSFAYSFFILSIFLMSQKRIYFDHAASTPLDKGVLQAMLPYLSQHQGNPNSTHQPGRYLKNALEEARYNLAELLGLSANELYFVSGGTEANNLALKGLIQEHNIHHVISSEIEHPSVREVLSELAQHQGVRLHYLRLSPWGQPDMNHLESLLKKLHKKPTLLSLMHVHNELGTLTDMDSIQFLSQKYSVWWHSDRVQALGHPELNSSWTGLHSFVASAHKFHGPKGIGLLYLQQGNKLSPQVHGGGQERNLRSGTENLAAIVGMAKALALHHQHWNTPSRQSDLHDTKQYAIQRLQAWREDISFIPEKTHPCILHIGIPGQEQETLAMRLDIEGISVSGGSACGSGAAHRSYVLDVLDFPSTHAYLRLSFDQNNTREEIDIFMEILSKISES